MDDTFRQYVASYGMAPKKPDAYTPYAAGYKMYGGGRSNPTNGPVDKAGYMQRDMLNRAKRDAVLAQMRANQGGQYMSPASLNGVL